MRLKEIREEKGISQKELAKNLGVSPTNVYNYEVGRTEPNLETLIKIARILDVTVDYLVGNSDEFGYLAGEAEGENLTLEECKLLQHFKGLDQTQREVLSDMAETLYNKNAYKRMAESKRR